MCPRISIAVLAALLVAGCKGDGDERPSSAVPTEQGGHRATPSDVTSSKELGARVKAYEKEYVAFSTGWSDKVRTLAATCSDQGYDRKAAPPADVIANAKDLLLARATWHQAHPAPAGMGPPLAPGEFPDAEGIRPSPQFTDVHADEERLAARLEALVAGKPLSALFDPAPG